MESNRTAPWALFPIFLCYNWWFAELLSLSYTLLLSSFLPEPSSLVQPVWYSCSRVYTFCIYLTAPTIVLLGIVSHFPILSALLVPFDCPVLFFYALSISVSYIWKYMCNCIQKGKPYLESNRVFHKRTENLSEILLLYNNGQTP